MSKKKQKKFATDADSIIFLLQRQADQQDEIIDLLHVIAENTKKPEPPSGPSYEINVSSIDDARAAAQRQHDWESVRGRKLGAAEEVEDYHGIATTEPYSVPVRIHR